MEVFEAIHTRRSIRGYKTDPVPKKVLEEIVEACQWAASPGNMQPWEFAILGGDTMEEFRQRLVEKTERAVGVAMERALGAHLEQDVALEALRLEKPVFFREGLARDFEGLAQVPESETREDFYKYYSGWMKYQDYVIARDLGVTMSKPIQPIAPGDYQVFLKVYDHKGQGSNQVEVTLNGVSRVVGWSGTEEGEKWIGALFENQKGGSELTITSLKREQWYIVIHEVFVTPLDKGEENEREEESGS